MSNIVITETGILTFTGLILAFLIKCCTTLEQSRCKKIQFSLCKGLECEREPMTADEMEAQSALFKAIQGQTSGAVAGKTPESGGKGGSGGVLVAERTTTSS